MVKRGTGDRRPGGIDSRARAVVSEIRNHVARAARRPYRLLSDFLEFRLVRYFLYSQLPKMPPINKRAGDWNKTRNPTNSFSASGPGERFMIFQYISLVIGDNRRVPRIKVTTDPRRILSTLFIALSRTIRILNLHNHLTFL